MIGMIKFNFKDGGDLLAVLFGTGYWFVEAVPWIASFLGAVWLAIRIYEWWRVRIKGKDAIKLHI